MKLLLVALFCLVLSQPANNECGASPPVTKENMPKQKVAYVQVETTGQAPLSDVMKRGYTLLTDIIAKQYPTSHVDFFSCSETNCLNGINLDSYTQVWVNDNSGGPDAAASQLAGYAKIADWYTNTMQKPHIICDGRLRSSLWDGRTRAFGGTIPLSMGDRPNRRLMHNYFINLGVRGGGLFLGTDHDVWANGINEVNRQIGISLFTNNYDDEPFALEVDTRSPVLTYPDDASEFTRGANKYMWDDSSTSDAPISKQRNDVILFPVGWHGSIGFNRPGVSSTIRGGVGFLVEITAPSCGALILPSQSVTFTGKQTSGTDPVASWSWSSNVDGAIGTGISFATAKLSPGQHIITLTAVDTNRFVATAKVVVVVLYSSGKPECIMTSRDGKQVREYFPIQRTPTAVDYYSYGSPVAQEANTKDGLEKSPLTANFALYDDGKKNGLNLIWVNSRQAGPATMDVTIGISGTGFTPDVRLKDDPNDNFLTFTPATKSGVAKFAFQASTKGFIIGPLPDNDGDRWCLELKVDVKSVTAIKTVNVWGHARNSTVYPSAERLSATAEGALNTQTFSFCRISCNCAGLETRTAMSGTIEPVRVNQGGDGSIGQTYTPGVLCTWAIAPVPGKNKRDTLQGVPGITIWFEPRFDINTEDSLTIWNGDQKTGTVVLDKATGTTKPNTFNVMGPKATVGFATTAALKTNFGWILNYAVIPTFTAITPNKGVLTEPTLTTFTGTFFANNPNAQIKIPNVIINGKPETILLPVEKWISPTEIQVKIPGKVVGAYPTFYTNDARGGYFVGPVNYTWYDASCEAVKTCAGCTVRPECGFCNDKINPGKSFCYGKGGDKTCPVEANFVDDNKGCCTQCQELKSCNGGGACVCNDTCNCDAAHWGKACECLQCKADVAGKICSGAAQGVCNCNGTCACLPGFRGEACECKTCPGEPSPCTGADHGDCQCDGTCLCKGKWMNTPDKLAPGTCDCSTECPNNCSGHGKCVCGVCDCDPEWVLNPEDCSCRDCNPGCLNSQICTCNGTCMCKPGYTGEKCDQKIQCNASECLSCMDMEGCGWCDIAPNGSKCENKFLPLYCNQFNKQMNPRGVALFTSSADCPIGTAIEADVLSDNKADLLIAALVGSLGTAAAALGAMAFFMRPPPIEALAGGLSVPDAAMYHDSSIYVGAETASNPAFT